ncbi:hypothetical protein CTDIVETGP_2118 [Clostridium tyrobutyricum DIVETGP]|jgi:hypothetical protein|uniref:Uncharacterized protein n=1 Tax=Clostridium tyrobutyricum DIVETGP TaxID=1408889 RepID=W6N5Z3_CLOTY|nr:hypothetical protein CTK_C03430 [Clostridium tyrobutyricum]QCH26436.1 hypothetical protein EZN00_00025 [Clostridium tyrobutyricum]CDL92048.1 hypothetical protein CTDIVETGP_2118 [Clostridium tyrobutyricum DIVETGP]
MEIERKIIEGNNLRIPSVILTPTQKNPLFMLQEIYQR